MVVYNIDQLVADKRHTSSVQKPTTLRTYTLYIPLAGLRPKLPWSWICAAVVVHRTQLPRRPVGKGQQRPTTTVRQSC